VLNDGIYRPGTYESKSNAIVDRMRRGRYEARETYFFEDRWPTIAKSLKDDRLMMVKFNLCSWGYSICSWEYCTRSIASRG
jgi:hypothetical protein